MIQATDLFVSTCPLLYNVMDIGNHLHRNLVLASVRLIAYPT
jgi:hypothetical protein